MATFFIVNDSAGHVLGAELTLRAAHECGGLCGLAREQYSITAMNVPVCVETVRKLLAESGGYAQNIRHVHGGAPSAPPIRLEGLDS